MQHILLPMTRKTHLHPPSQSHALPPNQRQVKPSKSHSLLSAGLRRLRTISQSHQEQQQQHHHRGEEESRVEAAPVLDRTSISSSSSSAATPPLPALRLVAPTGPAAGLTPRFAQLRGIHFVGDANEDPDLDGDTTSNTVRSHSAKSSVSSSATTRGSTPISPCESCLFRSGLHERPGTRECNCPSCNPATPTRSILTESSEATQEISFARHLSSLPVTHAHLLQPLSPRACSAAFPPIDLESPFAPYAPTPPLSPPGIGDQPNIPHKSSGGFHLPKGLRRFPSTVTALKPGKNPIRSIHQMSFHSSGILSVISQSTNSLKARSPNTSEEIEALRNSQASPRLSSSTAPHACQASDFSVSFGTQASPQPCQLPWRGSATRRARSVRDSETSDRRSAVPFPPAGSKDEELDSPVKATRGRDRSSSAKSHLRGSLNTFLVPINRIRTYSSLNTIFRSRKQSMSSSRRPPSEESSFEAGDTTLRMRPDSCFEVLDAEVMSARQVNLNPDFKENFARPRHSSIAVG